MKSGSVIPSTYANVTISAFQNTPEITASVIAPANTGAQQEVAAPENIPRTNTDFEWCASVDGVRRDAMGIIGIPFPNIAKPARTSIKMPPKTYNSLWKFWNNCARLAAPSPMGIRTTAIPKKKIMVIFNICFFSRNAEARYAGSKMVIQHGANKATIPAKNDATIDAEKIISIFFHLTRSY